MSQKDPFRLLAPCQLGKRRRDKGALLAPPGRELAACANEPEGSFDLIGTVPISPKDPFRLLAPCQLGKRRRDKGALLAPAGREFAACANKPEGSFDVTGERHSRLRPLSNYQRSVLRSGRISSSRVTVHVGAVPSTRGIPLRSNHTTGMPAAFAPATSLAGESPTKT